ncbi:hypothetical protein Lser_V15G26961 [Lactuca serriola]
MVRERGESLHNEKKHRKWINRDREAENELLVHDYFYPDSLYDLSEFEERFRISRNLFLRIARDLERNYEFFQLRWDARGKRNFTTIQKYTTALRQLGHGIDVDTSDEYLKMSERTCRDCTYLFCEYVIELYREIYLQHPTKSDVEQFYIAHQAKHGFPWMIETVVSHYLWFWHAFFGMAGSNNDLNVLQAFPLFNNSLQGKTPYMSYVVNGNEYKYGYYLGDVIYPEYAIIVKSYSFPADEKRKLFKLAQESARKDVERAFVVLKQK